MIGISIKIQSINDAKSGIPVFEDINKPEDFIPANFEGVGILEGGMQSGKTSIMFRFKDKEGKVYIAETSADLFKGIYHALIGAEARFNQEKK